MKTTFFYILLTFQFPLHAQVISSFTDERDGQVYETVTYELKNADGERTTMTWMAENLNYATEGSYYRDDSPTNSESCGQLYTWRIATKSCPLGWRLPTDKDWTNLVNLYGGLNSAGKHLKSKSELWINGDNGTNKSLFNALPYGTGDGKSTYPNFGRYAIFWSASEKDEEYAWDWILASGWKKILRSDGHKLKTANSVRCIKNN